MARRRRRTVSDRSRRRGANGPRPPTAWRSATRRVARAVALLHLVEEGARPRGPRPARRGPSPRTPARRGGCCSGRGRGPPAKRGRDGPRLRLGAATSPASAGLAGRPRARARPRARTAAAACLTHAFSDIVPALSPGSEYSRPSARGETPPASHSPAIFVCSFAAGGSAGRRGRSRAHRVEDLRLQLCHGDLPASAARQAATSAEKQRTISAYTSRSSVTGPGRRRGVDRGAGAGDCFSGSSSAGRSRTISYGSKTRMGSEMFFTVMWPISRACTKSFTLSVHAVGDEDGARAWPRFPGARRCSPRCPGRRPAPCARPCRCGCRCG